MDKKGLVFIGMDVVADAIDLAERHRWTRVRAPSGLWRRLGVGTGAVLGHDDSPVHVAVAPADASLRGVATPSSSGLTVRHDADAFATTVEDCPVAEALIDKLLRSTEGARVAL